MRRLLALASITGLALLGTAGAAVAQGPMGSGAPRFELGVYAGGAYSSEWYESRLASSTDGVVTIAEDGEGFGIGITPAFGGTAALYLTPMFGLRLHYGYLP